jgi:hypothetical protein
MTLVCSCSRLQQAAAGPAVQPPAAAEHAPVLCTRCFLLCDASRASAGSAPHSRDASKWPSLRCCSSTLCKRSLRFLASACRRTDAIHASVAAKHTLRNSKTGTAQRAAPGSPPHQQVQLAA